MTLFNRPHVTRNFLFLVCSNNVSVLHYFRDITIACELEKSFSFVTILKIIGDAAEPGTPSDSCGNIPANSAS